MKNTVTDNDTHARVNKQMYLNIRWAKVFNDEKSTKKAQFSGDLCLNDGTKICTINRLCILSTTNKKTGEPATYIGSMSDTLPRGDTIYSITWFPDSKKGNKEDIQARDNFSAECVRAVIAFHKRETNSTSNLELSLNAVAKA
jgi:hypothetical protein